jgi:hypothetical protein
LAKRRRLLLSNSHLLEIDLVRRGKRVPVRDPLPAAPYFVLLSRVETRPVLDVWPIGFSDPLPSVPVPLLPGDADVMLDRQLALTNVYDQGGRGDPVARVGNRLAQPPGVFEQGVPQPLEAVLAPRFSRPGERGVSAPCCR